MKKLLIAALALLLVAVVGGWLAVRALLDPENVRQTLERQASTALGQPVSIGSADLALWPRAGVTLGAVSVGSPAAVTLTRTRISTSMRALLDRRIVDAEVVVEDSDLDLPLVLATLDRLSSPGGSGGAAPAAEDTAGGVTLVNVRTLALRDVRVRAGSREATFTMESALDGDRLDIQSATVTSPRSPPCGRPGRSRAWRAAPAGWRSPPTASISTGWSSSRRSSRGRRCPTARRRPEPRASRPGPSTWCST
ncbi:MAG: AsmA family protein [Vicinamibacterales bacterium]